MAVFISRYAFNKPVQWLYFEIGWYWSDFFL